MAAPSYTYTLANSTTADADEVMQNFNDILNGVSDGTKDLSINALTVAGAATFNGNVTLGNATGDTVSYTARVASDIVPSTSAARNLGSSSLAWIGLYLDNGATDGGAVYFDASSSKFLKANAAGTEIELSGFTTFDTNGAQQKEMALYAEAKSANYTITDTDGVSLLRVTTGSTNRTMTLPTAADNTGRVITIIKIDSGTGKVIVDGEGSETINGSSQANLIHQYNSASFISDGTNWIAYNIKQDLDWTAYTPSNTQGFGTISGNNLEYRREGSTLWIRGYFTTGTVTASEAQLGLPSSVTLDTIGTADTIPCGVIYPDSTSTLMEYAALATAGDSFINFAVRTDGSNQNLLIPMAGSTAFGSSTRYAVNIGPIPIAEWAFLS